MGLGLLQLFFYKFYELFHTCLLTLIYFDKIHEFVKNQTHRRLMSGDFMIFTVKLPDFSYN